MSFSTVLREFEETLLEVGDTKFEIEETKLELAETKLELLETKLEIEETTQFHFEPSIISEETAVPQSNSRNATIYTGSPLTTLPDHVTAAYNQNISTSIKKADFEVIIIDSDDGDCEMKENSSVHDLENVFTSDPLLPVSDSSSENITISIENTSQALSGSTTTRSENSQNSLPTGNTENPRVCNRKLTVGEFRSSKSYSVSQIQYKKLPERRFLCIKCNIVIKHSSTLRRHLHFHCKYQKRYNIECKLCGSTCSNPDSLRYHFESTHSINDALKLTFLINESFLIPAENSPSESNSRVVRSVKRNQRVNLKTTSSPRSETVTQQSSPVDNIFIVDNLKLREHTRTLQECYSWKYDPIFHPLFHLNLRGLSCELCNKFVSNIQSFRDHVLFDCPAQTRCEITCKIYGTSAANPTDMKAHILITHGAKNKQELESIVRNSVLTPIENSHLDKSLTPASNREPILKVNHISENKTSSCNELKISHKGVSDDHAHFEIDNTITKTNVNTDSPFGNFSERNEALERNNFICDTCKISFIDPGDLEHHLDSHEIIGIKCQSCNIHFEEFAIFKNHLRIIRKVFVCGTAQHESEQSQLVSSIIPDVSVKAQIDISQDLEIACHPVDFMFSVKNLNLHEHTRTLNECYSSKYDLIFQPFFQQLNLKEWSCKFCNKNVSNTQCLRDHVLFDCPAQKRCTIRCKICDSSATNPVDMKVHVLLKHGVKSKQELESILRVSVLTPFENSHLDKPLSPASVDRELNSYCDFCEKSFNDCYALKRHQDFKCPFQKRYQMMCKICGFASSDSVNNHAVRVHGIKNKYEAREFAVKVKIGNSSRKVSSETDDTITKTNVNTDSPIGNILERKEAHETIIFSCETCKISFSNLADLEHHLEQEIIDIKCQFCNIHFQDFGIFKNHLIITGKKFVCGTQQHESEQPQLVSSIIPDVTVKPEIDKSQENPLTCNVCQKEYLSVDALVKHLNDHLLFDGTE